MNINQNEIHLWLLDITDIKPHLAQLTSILSTAEQNKAARFQFSQHQQSYLAAHVLKRLVLAKYLQLKPQALQFSYLPGGKPQLHVDHQSSISFNLSHSQQMIAFAVTANDAIGVDIQFQHLHTNYRAIIARYFSVQEQQRFAMITDQACQRTAFFRAWTRKEAYLKATGQGISSGMSGFSVDITIDPTENWLTVEQPNTHVNWQLYFFTWQNDYQLAVVSHGKNKRLVTKPFCNALELIDEYKE